MTTDDIFFLSKIGKAGIRGRPAPWPGWGSSLQNGCWCPKFPSSEHHPLPLISIWEMGGKQWNYCITKLARTHFLWVKYCAEYTNSSNATSPIIIRIPLFTFRERKQQLRKVKWPVQGQLLANGNVCDLNLGLSDPRDCFYFCFCFWGVFFSTSILSCFCGNSGGLHTSKRAK